MISEKIKADEFVDKFFQDSNVAAELKESNYFMNPRARNLLLEQVKLIFLENKEKILNQRNTWKNN